MYTHLWAHCFHMHLSYLGPVFCIFHILNSSGCFWIVVLENTLESLLDCKEIQPVHPKGNQSWIFIGRTDAEAETPILWPPEAKNWLTGKDPDAGKDWRQEEDEMVGWHHWLDEHEFEKSLGVSDGQGSLACCSPWGCRVRRDWTTEPNWTDWNYSAHCGEWLQPEGCQIMQGFFFLSALMAQELTFGGPELLMTMASLFTDMTVNIPFLISFLPSFFLVLLYILELEGNDMLFKRPPVVQRCVCELLSRVWLFVTHRL